MKAQHTIDVNTPQRYDEIYFGSRTIEMMPVTVVINMMRMFFRHGKFLDIGCGLGRYFGYIRDCEIHGVDFSEKVCQKAREDNPSATVLCHDITAGLPYTDNTFDYILCAEVLEHMKDPQALVNEIYRVLKPDGIVIIATPFENRIVCDEHLWEFTDLDLLKFMEKFTNTSVLRYYNVRSFDWEQFLAIGQKG